MLLSNDIVKGKRKDLMSKLNLKGKDRKKTNNWEVTIFR